MAGVGSRLEGDASEAVPDDALEVDAAVFVAEVPDVFAADDWALGDVGVVGAVD